MNKEELQSLKINNINKEKLQSAKILFASANKQCFNGKMPFAKEMQKAKTMEEFDSWTKKSTDKIKSDSIGAIKKTFSVLLNNEVSATKLKNGNIAIEKRVRIQFNVQQIGLMLDFSLLIKALRHIPAHILTKEETITIEQLCDKGLFTYCQIHKTFDVTKCGYSFIPLLMCNEVFFSEAEGDLKKARKFISDREKANLRKSANK